MAFQQQMQTALLCIGPKVPQLTLLMPVFQDRSLESDAFLLLQVREGLYSTMQGRSPLYQVMVSLLLPAPLAFAELLSVRCEAREAGPVRQKL